MTAHDRLPSGWPLNYSPDATDRLRQLERDKLEAKYEIRQVLDKYAERYDIRALLVSDLLLSYVDDMLTDLFDVTEEALRREVEQAIEREAEGESRADRS